MKKYWIFLLFALILVSCLSKNEKTPVIFPSETPTGKISITPKPTSTPENIITLTLTTNIPKNTITPTLKPTPNLIPPYIPTHIGPTGSDRTPTYPSGDPNNYSYDLDDCSLSTRDEIRCSWGIAYDSARELDNLLIELDNHFPNGSWELAVKKLIIPQEEWESLKRPYCQYAVQGFIGGTGYSAFLAGCIHTENLARIEKLEGIACSWFRGFTGCPPRKPGGENPLLTAQPTPTNQRKLEP